MLSKILGEPNKYADNGFIGSDTAGGAFVGYRNPRRRQPVPPGAVPEKPVPPGAVPEKPAPVAVVNNNITETADLRARIRVPLDYLTEFTAGGQGELSYLSGIIFPYTPTITAEWRAEYGSLSPTHSNYMINFYKNSSVGDISVSGKFTVQNDKDALVYLATLHLLRSLTKMRWGGKNGDPDSGAPPPVCRFDAYGAFQYKNIPVVITSFKNDLPADVDFYAYNRNGNNTLVGPSFCPVSSTVQVTLRPMYSRREMQEISTGKYLNDSGWKSKGYL